MANVDRPNGFKFAKSLSGHAPNAMLRKYSAIATGRSATTGTDAAGNTVDFGDLYLGDAVTLNIVGNVQVAVSGNPVLGVIAGIGTADGIQMGDNGPFNAEMLQDRFLTATQAGDVWVIPAEDTLFEVQSDIALTNSFVGADADLSIGLAASAVAGVHGNRTTSRSIQEITDLTNADVRIVEINTGVENDPTLINARYLVKFNDTVNATVTSSALPAVA